MTGGTVYSAGWTLDDVQWSRFDSSKVEPSLLASMKAASLVEYNAADYVTLSEARVEGFRPADAAAIELWGREEVQHGQALGRWAEMADPSFNFMDAFERFHAGYKPPHFASDDALSVRGSRRGEMVARCVVESGTSSFYSAIRDATDEPVLKEIAGRIAADEFRHYRLFFETLHAQDEPDLPFWRKLWVAVSRVNETDDDEFSLHFTRPTFRLRWKRPIPITARNIRGAAHADAMTLYRRPHINKMVQMVAKAVGANPQSRTTAAASAVLWRVLRMRAGLTRKPAPVAA
jgi:hypothetical protein